MNNIHSKKSGSLVCVGLGMMLGAHLTPSSRSHIEQADIIFSSGNSGFIDVWLKTINSNVISLQECYQQGKSRRQSYQEMTELLLTAVRQEKKVVAAFYGHPGVFVSPSHQAIKQAQVEGYFAKMEPGISAEDCLVADCGLDPGSLGWACFEATQFLRFERRIDTSAYLVLWQVGVVGDSTLTQFSTSPSYRALLVEVLTEHYPQNHPIILYQAPRLAIEKTRIDKMPLIDFINAEVNQCTTMIITPANKLKVNKIMTDKLQKLERQRQAPKLSTIT